MRKTRVTIRQTVKHSTQPFSQHNVRFYGRHVEFWNHLQNTVLHPLIAQTYSGKVTKAFFLNSKSLLNSMQKNWSGGNSAPRLPLEG